MADIFCERELEKSHSGCVQNRHGAVHSREKMMDDVAEADDHREAC